MTRFAGLSGEIAGARVALPGTVLSKLSVFGLVLVCATTLVSPSSAQADTHVGVMLDAGLPDGAHGSLVVLPKDWLRLHAGAGYNGISAGMRGGVSLIPFQWNIRPAFVAEVGRYFEGDANPLMRAVLGNDDYHNSALSRVGYDYANAHAGIEFGVAVARVYVHAGYSYIFTSVHQANALFGGSTEDAGVDYTRNPRARVLIPSARFGLIFYLN